MNIKKALLLSGLVLSAGTVLANPKNEEGLKAKIKKERKQKEEETYEFFPVDENAVKWTLCRCLEGKLSCSVLSPQDDHDKIIRDYYVKGDVALNEDQRKAFAAKSEKIWEAIKGSEFVDKKTFIKSFQKVVFSRSLRNHLFTYKLVDSAMGNGKKWFPEEEQDSE